VDEGMGAWMSGCVDEPTYNIQKKHKKTPRRVTKARTAWTIIPVKTRMRWASKGPWLTESNHEPVGEGRRGAAHMKKNEKMTCMKNIISLMHFSRFRDMP